LLAGFAGEHRARDRAGPVRYAALWAQHAAIEGTYSLFL